MKVEHGRVKFTSLADVQEYRQQSNNIPKSQNPLAELKKRRKRGDTDARDAMYERIVQK